MPVLHLLEFNLKLGSQINDSLPSTVFYLYDPLMEINLFFFKFQLLKYIKIKKLK